MDIFSFVSFSPPVCRVVLLSLEFSVTELRALRKHFALSRHICNWTSCLGVDAVFPCVGGVYMRVWVEGQSRRYQRRFVWFAFSLQCSWPSLCWQRTTGLSPRCFGIFSCQILFSCKIKWLNQCGPNLDPAENIKAPAGCNTDWLARALLEK